MHRSAWLAVLVLASGCAGLPKPGSPQPKLAVVEAPKPVAEKAPPPEPRPLPVVSMQLSMHAQHLDANVGRVRAQPTDDKLVAAKLTQPWRGRFETALAATAKLEKAATPVAEAHFAVLGCNDDCDAASAKHDKLRAAFDKEAERLTRAHDKTIALFEKQLEKAPSVELGLALARLHDESSRHSDIVTMNHPAEYGFDYGEFGASWDAGGSSLAVPALERAKALSEASTELGRMARYALLVHHWSGGEPDAALEELLGLLPRARPEELYELHARHGLLLGHRGEHRQAAEAFGRALDQPEVKGEAVARAQLRSARVVAEYRAGRFREALALALAELDRGAPTSAFFVRGSPLELRVAADALERLAGDVDSLGAKPETKAQLLGKLALRAAHRHDQTRARELAARAVALSPKHASEAFSVLIALAKQKGDAERAREFEEQQKQARTVGVFGDFGLLALLGSRQAAPEHDEKNALKDDAKPDGKRNVASLFRLCLEPSFWRLPARGGKQAVDLKATLKDDGSISIELSGDAPSELTDCLRSMGPEVLARAPSSIEAHVELGTARQAFGGLDGVLGGLAGSGIGEAFGAGGLGLSGRGLGGGGSGQGTIGIGSLGTRGQGAGTGSGYGRGPKTPKKPAPTKKAK